MKPSRKKALKARIVDGSRSGKRDRCLAADAEGLGHRPIGDVADKGRDDDDQVLAQSRGSRAEDLADQQLARGGRRDEQLHDAPGLLLGHALRHPIAIGQDRHEGKDDDRVGEDEGTAEVLVVGGVVRVDRRRRERRGLEDLGGLLLVEPRPPEPIRDRERGGRLGDERPRLVGRAGAPQVFEGELAVLVAGDRQEAIELAVANPLLGCLRVVRARHARPLPRVLLRLGRRVCGWIGADRERRLDREHWVARQVVRLDGDRDLGWVRHADRGQDGRHQRHRRDRHREQRRRDGEGAPAHPDQVLPASDVQGVRQKVSHAASSRVELARCSSDSSTARRPTCSTKISSRLGSAISKRVTRSPRSRAARRIEVRIAIGGDVQLDVVLALVGQLHAGQLPQPRDAVAVALGRQSHDAAAHRALHVPHGAAHDHLADVDDGDRLAQLLDRLHLVGAEDEGLAAVAHLEEGLLEQPHVDWVEPREGLIHDQHLGVVKDRRDELDLLLVPLRELLDLALAVVGDSESLEPVVDFRACGCVGHPVQRREEPQLLSDQHLRIEPSLLRQVAPRSAGKRHVLGTLPGDAAGIGAEDVEHDPHTRRLAGTVRAEEAEDPSRLHAERRPRRGRRRHRNAS